MECPHCGSDFDAKPHTFQLGMDQDGTWHCANLRCPTCDHLIVSVHSDRGKDYPMLPPGSARAKLSEYVPAELAADYWTASQILPFSEEASAAISRRLLQRVLSWKAGAGYGGLANQVERALASPTMPAYLKEALATYVKLARLEAHDVKSFRCETLTRVNEGEALWLLELLKPLFEFYYVQPALVELMRRPIEDKLAPPPTDEPDELEQTEGRGEDWTVVSDEPAPKPTPGPAPETPATVPPAKEPVR